MGQMRLLGMILGWILSLALLAMAALSFLGAARGIRRLFQNIFTDPERSAYLLGEYSGLLLSVPSFLMLAIGALIAALVVNPHLKSDMIDLKGAARWLAPGFLLVMGFCLGTYGLIADYQWPKAPRLEAIKALSPQQEIEANLKTAFGQEARLIVLLELCGGDASDIHQFVIGQLREEEPVDLTSSKTRSAYIAGIRSAESGARYNLSSGSSPKYLVCKHAREAAMRWRAATNDEERKNAVRRI
jgi:hypothetical protein